MGFAAWRNDNFYNSEYSGAAECELLYVYCYMYTAVQSIIILAAIIFENVKNRVIQ